MNWKIVADSSANLLVGYEICTKSEIIKKFFTTRQICIILLLCDFVPRGKEL